MLPIMHQVTFQNWIGLQQLLFDSVNVFSFRGNLRHILHYYLRGLWKLKQKWYLNCKPNTHIRHKLFIRLCYSNLSKKFYWKMQFTNYTIIKLVETTETWLTCFACSTFSRDNNTLVQMPVTHWSIRFICDSISRRNKYRILILKYFL